ncbi:MAG: gluconokinase [Candidatus Acidiferrales bacterium]
MIVIVMGPEGVGKTTVGTLLARELGWQFVDADDFHPPANIEKMARGIPLTDTDRAPWLAALHDAIMHWDAERRNVVLACSALERSYRARLAQNADVEFVYLKGSYELIAQRIRTREGHFAHEDLLASQFAILEEPQDAITVDASRTPEEIAEEVRKRLGLA